MVTFTRVSAEYTPAEAAEITGVSTALQRDWRRREILRFHPSEGRHSRFNFEHLCEMFALKAFSDAGLGVAEMSTAESKRELQGNGNAQSAARFCLFPMLYFADTCLVRAGKKKFMTVSTRNPSGVVGRYVFVTPRRMFRAENLSAAELAMEEDPNWDHAVVIVFDCKKAAERLVSRLTRPPYEFVESSEPREA